MADEQAQSTPPRTTRISTGSGSKKRGGTAKKSAPRPSRIAAAPAAEVPAMDMGTMERLIAKTMEKMMKGARPFVDVQQNYGHAANGNGAQTIEIARPVGGTVSSFVNSALRRVDEQQTIVREIIEKLSAIDEFDYGKLDDAGIGDRELTFAQKAEMLDNRLRLLNLLLQKVSEHISHSFE